MWITFQLLLAVAWAHPYGSNLYGHRTEVWLDREQVQVGYVAEVPTPVLLRDLRHFLAGKEAPTQADQDQHTARWLSELEGGLALVIDGERQAWVRETSEEPSGVGNSRFIQYHLMLRAPMPADARTINLVNGNLPDNPALFSTEVFIGDGVVLDESSLIDVDHGQVTADRDGQWRPEESARELRMSFRLRGTLGTSMARTYRRVAGGTALEGDYMPGRSRLSQIEPELLPSLVKGEITLRAGLIAVLIAIVLGAMHAFSPGHGKALVAAYLLGERKTIRHAVGLGGVVTVAHTITVFALGGVALALTEVVSTEALLPWLELASGLLVLGVGVQLVRRRLRGTVGPGDGHDHVHHHDDHDHDHDDDHDDDHDHATAHAAQYADASSWRDLIALGISGGIAPCPSALVLLLTAISFHRIAFGIVLVFFFSLGLALLVTAVGIAVVLLGDRIRALPRSETALKFMPVASAAIVTLLGIGITFKGITSVFGT